MGAITVPSLVVAWCLVDGDWDAAERLRLKCY